MQLAHLFLDRGIPATSMEAVAERARVSKMTLYSHFSDKSALLAAVFERTLKETVLPELAEDGVPAAERLSEFGERLVGYLTQPEIVRTATLMAASASEFPDLAAAFYAAGPAAVLARVAHISNGRRRGRDFISPRLRLPPNSWLRRGSGLIN